MGKWADDKLKEVLGSYKYKFGGGELKVTSVSSFKGESSISIRKGKKILSYDYNVKLKWECTLRDGDGNEVGSLKGDYELPEISNDIDDDGEDYEVRVTFGEDKSNLKSRFESMIRKDAPKDLRKTIKEQFVNELKQK